MRVPLAHGVRKVRAAQKVLPCHVSKSVSSHGQRDFGSCLVYLSEPLVAGSLREGINRLDSERTRA